MVVLDATIVNIALPSAQQALGFSDDDRQWIVTALRAGVRQPAAARRPLGDLFGRKRTLIVGLLGFAVASALGGAAQSFGVLVGGARAAGRVRRAARALRAVAADDDLHRRRASATRRSGSSARSPAAAARVGLLLGGVLTEYLSWRWCLYVNLFFARPGRRRRRCACCHNQRLPAQPHLDLPGALTAAAGLFALVYGFSNAETHGWGAPVTLGSLGAGVVAARPRSSLIERRVAAPAAAAAHRAGPRPRRRLPRGRLIAGRRHLRRLPVPHLLPAADPRLLAARDRPRLPADDRRHRDHRRRSRQTRAAAALGPRPLVARRHDARPRSGMVLLTRLDASTRATRRTSCPALLIVGAGLGLVFATAFEHRDLRRRRRRTRASPRRWSTPASRSAARSAPRC